MLQEAAAESGSPDFRMKGSSAVRSRTAPMMEPPPTRQGARRGVSEHAGSIGDRNSILDGRNTTQVRPGNTSQEFGQRHTDKGPHVHCQVYSHEAHDCGNEVISCPLSLCDRLQDCGQVDGSSGEAVVNDEHFDEWKVARGRAQLDAAAVPSGSFSGLK